MCAKTILSFLTAILTTVSVNGEKGWPQAAGPNGDFSVSTKAPVEWSVVKDENILWKLTLPETGQSTPVVSNEKVFFTTLKPVTEDATLGKDLIAWCVDSATGKVNWKRPIPGRHLCGCRVVSATATHRRPCVTVSAWCSSTPLVELSVSVATETALVSRHSERRSHAAVYSSREGRFTDRSIRRIRTGVPAQIRQRPTGDVDPVASG